MKYEEVLESCTPLTPDLRLPPLPAPGPNAQTYMYDLRPVLSHGSTSGRRIGGSAATETTVDSPDVTARENDELGSLPATAEQQQLQGRTSLPAASRGTVTGSLLPSGTLPASVMRRSSSSSHRVHGMELRLVLELCDCGSLRDVLDQVRIGCVWGEECACRLRWIRVQDGRCGVILHYPACATSPSENPAHAPMHPCTHAAMCPCREAS